MNECEMCPLIEEFKIIRDEVKKDIKQMQSEVKQNERAWTKLSSDLVIHMHNSETRSKEIHKEVKLLNEAFSKHIDDENEAVKDLKKSIDDFKQGLFHPENGVFTKLKEVVIENKFKTLFMWTAGGFGFITITGILVYIFQESIFK